MIALVFSYEVRDPDAFERATAPTATGRSSSARESVTSARSCCTTSRFRRRYLVIDRWESADAYNAFAAEQRESTCAASTTRASSTTRSCASGRSRTCGTSRALIPPHHDPGLLGLRRRTGRHPSASSASRKARPSTRRCFAFDERHQGGPGFVHGGLVAAALDEACGLLATWYRFPTVTARIFVRYRRPVEINTELLVRATLTGERGRRLHIDGEIVRRKRGARRGARGVPPRAARAFPRDAGGPRLGGRLERSLERVIVSDRGFCRYAREGLTGPAATEGVACSHAYWSQQLSFSL